MIWVVVFNFAVWETDFFLLPMMLLKYGGLLQKTFEMGAGFIAHGSDRWKGVEFGTMRSRTMQSS